MKLSIDIDDAELNEVITSGIKGLSTETITDLAKEALNSYLQTNEGIEGVIFEDTTFVDLFEELPADVTLLPGAVIPHLLFTKRGLTISVYNYNKNFNDTCKEIVNGMYNWWVESALDLIEESYGLSFDNITLDLYFENKPDSGRYAATGGNAFSHEMIINIAHLDSLVSLLYNPNGNTKNGIRYNYFDRLLSHELTHAALQCNVTSGMWLSFPQFFSEGIAELTAGGDDIFGADINTSADYIRNTVGDSTKLKSKVNLNDYDTEDLESYAAGYVFLRWLAKTVSESLAADEKSVPELSYAFAENPANSITVEDHYIFIDASNVTHGLNLTGNAKDNQMFGTVYDDTLRGLDGNDLLSGGYGDDVLFGGNGDDTLNGGDGNNTLTGGEGNDVFFYDGGNVLITDYEPGKDIIKYTEKSTVHWKAEGNDLIITLDAYDYGKITVRNGNGVDVSEVGPDNEAVILYDGDDGAKFIGNSKGNAPTLGSGNATAYGNEGDDTIHASTGYTTVYGGPGSDVFVNTGGHDLVMDYTTDDRIKIENGWLSSSVTSGNDIILYTTYYGTGWYSYYRYNGSITLKNAAGKYVNFVGTDDRSTLYSADNNSILKSHSSAASTLTSFGDNSTVSGNDGNDRIYNYGYHAVIDGGAGFDVIRIMENANNSTVSGGKDNDDIDLYSNQNTILYTYGDGDDVIYGFNETDVLKIDGAFSTLVSGEDVIVSVTRAATNRQLSADYDGDALDDETADAVDGTISLLYAAGLNLNIVGNEATVENTVVNDGTDLDDNLRNYDDNALFDGGEGDDTLVNNGSNSTLRGGDGNDYIDSPLISTEKNILDGGAGDDTIKNSSSDSTIRGGDGNDSIINNLGNTVSIDGGAGDDYIADLWSMGATIRAGKGNDTIYSNNSAELIMYSSGDGSDVIYGADTDTTLQISGNYNIEPDGDDMIVRIGSGSIALKNMSDKPVNVNGIVLPAGVSLNKKATKLTVANPFGGTLNVADYSDKVKTVNATKAGNAIALVGNDLNNVIKVGAGGSSLDGGAGNDKLCGNNGGVDHFYYTADGSNDVISKYKAGQDYIHIDAAIEGVEVKGSKVIFTIGDGTLTVKNAAKKEMRLVDAEGEVTTYRFTKENNDLASARIEESDQLSASGYWFMDDQPMNDDQNLSQIISSECALDLSTEFSSELFKSTIPIVAPQRINDASVQ